MDFRERYQYDAQNDLLGKGGFSTVYKAKDRLLDRFVALKFFKNQELHKYDVLTEIRKVIQLEHPNITRYFDVATLENRTVHGEVEKVQVGVMEYINSGDIKIYLKNHPEQFDNLIVQVLNGIQYLHNNSIIHRDLKPQNILVKVQNDAVTAKITDFGISKLIDSTSTTTQSLLGTLAYMAPEQLDPKHFGIDGKTNTNLDFWSFGILLYDLLTGMHPFIDNNSNTAEQIMRNILMGDIANKIASIKNPVYREMLEKCLVKDANKRVKNARELLNIKEKPIEKPKNKLKTEPKEKQNVVFETVTNNVNNTIQNSDDMKDKSNKTYALLFYCSIFLFILIFTVFFDSKIEWVTITINGLILLGSVVFLVENSKKK